MIYYEIKVNNSFIHSYKFHLLKLNHSHPNYASKLATIIRNKFKIIQRFPFSNQILKLPRDRTIYHKMIIDGKYHIIYAIKTKTIHILYFSDGRQSPQTYFKLLNIFNSLN